MIARCRDEDMRISVHMIHFKMNVGHRQRKEGGNGFSLCRGQETNDSRNHVLWDAFCIFQKIVSLFVIVLYRLFPPLSLQAV